MKALQLLTALSLTYSTINAKDVVSLESYISQNKQAQFSYDYKKNIAQTSMLRDSWIAPVILSYSYVKSNPSSQKQTNQVAVISIDQPIFQSGGIYFGIKYANALKKYSDYGVDIAKKKAITDALSLLMQIQKTDLSIKRQELQIQNAQINLLQKKEQYLNGQLDSGFLDQAIIELNSVTQRLYDIQTSKERLISSFATLSDLKYEKVILPHLTLLSKVEFLTHNIALNMAKEQIQKDYYSKNMVIAKYLPRVSVTAGYTWSKTEDSFLQVTTPALANPDEQDYYNYGVKIVIPLNINTFVDVEQAKVDFLKSKLQEEERVVQMGAVFEQVMQNINNLEKKEELSIENIKLYKKLLLDTKNLLNAGYKTHYDVELLENSLKMSELDAQIYALDKQLELLNLYEMYADEI